MVVSVFPLLECVWAACRRLALWGLGKRPKNRPPSLEGTVLGTVLCTDQRPMEPRDGHVHERRTSPEWRVSNFPLCVVHSESN